MKKLVEFAEKYVEWVALGLGALFLLLMAWMYLLSSPVSAEVDKPPKTVTLGTVDKVIYEDVASGLQSAMNNDRLDLPITVTGFSDQFRAALQLSAAPPTTMAANGWMGYGGLFAVRTPDIKLPPDQQVPAVANRVPGPLPAAVWNSVSLGRSVVKPEEPAPGAPAAVAAPAPAAAPGAEPAKLGTEKIWVTEAFTISAGDIAKAFREASVAENLTTAFVGFELIREEMQPDGSWGNRKVIPPLAMHSLRPMPPVGDLTAESEYLDWAVGHAQTLALPSFYPILAGDQWYAPGQPNPNKVAETTMKAVTPKATPPVRPPQPPRTGRRRSYQQVTDPQRPTLADALAQMPPGAAGAPPYMPPGGMPPGSMPPPMPPEAYQAQPGTPAGVAVPTSAIPKGYTVPTGNFVPAAMKEDFFVWAHDDSAQPDHTYRYKLRYYLKNPLFRSANVSDQKIARQFSITSPEGEWGTPVYVPPTVYIFLAGGFMTNGGAAKFDTLRWQNGTWTKQSFTASPGDQVGNSDGSATTGWTLVDTRLDVLTREPKAVLADAAGNLTVRSLRLDQALIIQTQKDIGYVEPAPTPKTGAPGAGEMGMPPGGPIPPGGFPPPPGMR